jgi:uncharacterized protein YkwD
VVDLGRTLRVVAALLAVVALAVPAAATSAPTRIQAHALVAVESGVLASLNRVRAEHGLVELTSSTELDASALQHSREMAADGYFEHASANGIAFWRRIASWYPQLSHSRIWAVGENLLWSSPSIGAQGVVRLWMHSAEHRQNILNPDWREVGIAVLHASSAPGAYGNHAVTVVTADFGVRR